MALIKPVPSTKQTLTYFTVHPTLFIWDQSRCKHFTTLQTFLPHSLADILNETGSLLLVL